LPNPWSLFLPDWIPFIAAGMSEASVSPLVSAAKTQAAPGYLMANHSEASARQVGLALLAIPPGEKYLRSVF
jgi:hypothetical protein